MLIPCFPTVVLVVLENIKHVRATNTNTRYLVVYKPAVDCLAAIERYTPGMSFHKVDVVAEKNVQCFQHKPYQVEDSVLRHLLFAKPANLTNTCCTDRAHRSVIVLSPVTNHPVAFVPPRKAKISRSRT